MPLVLASSSPRRRDLLIEHLHKIQDRYGHLSAPHLAGSAAILLANHPDWSPAEVKSALTNTADDVVRNAKNGLTTVGPMAQGAGRENLGDANLRAVFAELDRRGIELALQQHNYMAGGKKIELIKAIVWENLKMDRFLEVAEPAVF